MGLMFGSFVNALVWRIYEQDKKSRKSKASKSKAVKDKKSGSSSQDMSILTGRSMCVHCHHKLATQDLIPVISWVGLRGKCRYCHKPISPQYPLVELLTAGLFVASYIWWPSGFEAAGIINFVVWCVLLVGFMALFVYDLRWLLLPDRITYPLIALAALLAAANITVFGTGLAGLRDTAISVLVASGLFYGLFHLSKGKWIGGGDVKLGLVIGLVLAVPLQAFLVLFLASLIGTITILPSLATKKLKATSHIPFGPFLIVATIIVRLFGASMITWYRRKFLLY